MYTARQSKSASRDGRGPCRRISYRYGQKAHARCTHVTQYGAAHTRTHQYLVDGASERRMTASPIDFRCLFFPIVRGAAYGCALAAFPLTSPFFPAAAAQPHTPAAAPFLLSAGYHSAVTVRSKAPAGPAQVVHLYSVQCSLPGWAWGFMGVMESGRQPQNGEAVAGGCSRVGGQTDRRTDGCMGRMDGWVNGVSGGRF